MPHVDLIKAIELIGLGLFVGAISPTFGIGGGLVTVPLLILIYGMPTATATATSLGVIIFVSLSGTLAYIREYRIDFRVGLLFVVFAVPGSVAGGLASNWLRSISLHIDLLQILFAVTMLAVSTIRITSVLRAGRSSSATAETETMPRRFAVRRSFTDRHGVEFSYTARLWPGMIIAVLGGFLGAMLGLGGGVVYVPILTAVMGLPVAIATATSTFTILFANPFAVLIRFASIQWDIVLFLSIGVVVSATIVPRFLHRVQAKWLLTGFWTLAILASIRLLLKVAGVAL